MSTDADEIPRPPLDWKLWILARGLSVACALSFVVHFADETLAQWILIAALALAGPFFVHACAEPNAPLESARPPAIRQRFLIVGGGRTAALLVAALAAILLSFLAARALAHRDEGLWASDDPLQLAAIVCYAAVYVLAPTTLLAPFAHSAWGRSLARAASLALFFVPAYFHGAILDPRLALLADPFALLRAVTHHGDWTSDGAIAFRWLVELALGALVLASPRVLRGMRA